MKVLIFINTSWNIVNFRSGLIKALINKGYQVHALAPEDGYSDRLPAMGVHYHPITMDNSGSHLLKDLLLLRKIYLLYKKISPKLVLHYTIKPNIYGTIAAHWCNIPSINTVSGLGTVFLTKSLAGFIAKKLYRWSFGHPHMIFFQNPDDLTEFKTQGLLKKSNYQIVPGSGVNTKIFQPQSFPQRAPFTFLLMARLLEEKGIREYAKASEILKAKGIPIHCLLLGDSSTGHLRGISPKTLEAWVSSGFLTYLGETHDVRPVIASAHVVVLPSYREGLPKSLLEAASMGRPVITTDVAGCREVVKDQINGLLCEPKNAVDLASKMEIMCNRSDLQLQEMGRAGRALVESNFEESIIIDKYLNTMAHLKENT